MEYHHPNKKRRVESDLKNSQTPLCKVETTSYRDEMPRAVNFTPLHRFFAKGDEGKRKNGFE